MTIKEARQYVEDVGNMTSARRRAEDMKRLMEEDLQEFEAFRRECGNLWRAEWDGTACKLKEERDRLKEEIKMLREEVEQHIQIIQQIPDGISKEVLSLYAESLVQNPYHRNMRGVVHYEERGLSERNVLRHLKEKGYPAIAAAVAEYRDPVREICEKTRAAVIRCGPCLPA